MIKEIYAHFKKSNGISTDTRSIKNNSIFFALRGANFNANTFALQALEKGASYVIVDEKKYQTNKKIILVTDVLETLQKLANYHRLQLGIPIIALTGSNGKTTTKELINVVLSQKLNVTATKGNLNNHIGVPLTLLSMTKETEIGIVEMGANHLNEIAFLCNIAQPNFGYITNFGKAHLEGFGSIEGVIKAKTELYHYLEENNKDVFVNTTDAIQVRKSMALNKITFGSDDAVYPIHFIEANPFVKLKTNGTQINSKLIGSYNYNNIAAAIAIGYYFKIDIKKIKHAIENYQPINNRSQIINKHTNKIILDAYNANPSSMECALENFIQLSDNPKITILGDMFELGEYAHVAHQEIVNLLEKSTIEIVYLIGENFSKTSIKSDKIIIFKSYKDFAKNISFKKINHTAFLIKASRGMALERILDLI